MRSKRALLFATAICGAAGLAAGSQAWIAFTIAGASHEVTGHEINAAVSPIALALIAASIVLTIAGTVFRRVLGVLVALLGAGLAALAIGALVGPVAAAAPKATELTGLSGATGLDAVDAAAATWWVWLAAVAGIVAVPIGGSIVALAGRWSTAAGRKYETSKPAASGRGDDRISDWDALSDGDDPTEPA